MNFSRSVSVEEFARKPTEKSSQTFKKKKMLKISVKRLNQKKLQQLQRSHILSRSFNGPEIMFMTNPPEYT